MPLHVLRSVFLDAALLGRFSTPVLAGQLHQAVNIVAPRVLRHRVREILQVDASAALGMVTVPTLYLQATEDRVIWRQALSVIQARLPETSVVQISAPHFLLQAKPDEASRAIAGWMSKVTDAYR